ncbi:class I SAM-dependent methyltransferase [Chroococcidiopsis sp. CCMEE 29]|uniref:class I SAM-dependent methyltransferase n=1 Tax=Chroococcidiopsis sp. CCMEE 29 TaxID=155894 RepID=UPI002021E2F5|nr:class I SAM-dependent methyltransferase [Chroococcidiopsis sp. CCMEE 29]
MTSKNQGSLINELVPPEKMIDWVGGGGTSWFKQVGNEFFQYFVELCDLKPNEKVLDVGCGCGRIAVPLTEYLEDGGSYEGFDITTDEVNWCRENISTKYPNFRFHRANIYSKHYNPNGKVTASEYKFPYEDMSFDFVFLTSVFTHILPQELENYLSEIVRVLKRGGKCLISFFLLNPESLKYSNENLGILDFKYDFEYYRLLNPDVPEFAVAYKESFIQSLYEKHQLKIMEPIRYGSWCGRKEFLSCQDIIIAVK